MLLELPNISAALDAISNNISKATRQVEEYHHFGGDEWTDASIDWYMKQVFTQLEVVAEALGLILLRADISNEYARLRTAGIGSTGADPDGDRYLISAGPARMFVRSIEAAYVVESSHVVSKDLESILREAVYSINDENVFVAPPKNEAEVHSRIEAILRCLFPGMTHKPRIGKPIKNFEPDTGLPSIRTLIEYKYLSDKSQIGAIADQVLADTRGYHSPEWDSFVYAIYETKRFNSRAFNRNEPECVRQFVGVIQQIAYSC